MQSGMTRRRIAFSATHSSAADRVLDHVAPAGVQQPVEAAARALGEVGAVDEDHVEAAQRGVPRDAGAGRAAADHEHVGLQLGHESGCLCAGRRRGDARGAAR